MTMNDAPPEDGAGDESPPADDLVGDWVPADRPGHPAPVESRAVGPAAGEPAADAPADSRRPRAEPTCSTSTTGSTTSPPDPGAAARS